MKKLIKHKTDLKLFIFKLYQMNPLILLMLNIEMSKYQKNKQIKQNIIKLKTILVLIPNKKHLKDNILQHKLIQNKSVLYLKTMLFFMKKYLYNTVL